MIFLDPATGCCVEAMSPPAPGWPEVPGHGVLLRRPEAGRWQAIHVYAPDIPHWLGRGWERVRLRGPAARPIAFVHRGGQSGLRIGFAPEARAARPGKATRVWVVLPDEAGREAPIDRPGAQALFTLDALERGVVPEQLASELLSGRIVALGLPIDPSLWVLRGPPVSPEDSRVLRRLNPILALAERLSADLRVLVVAAAARLERAALADAPAAPRHASQAPKRRPRRGAAAPRRS